MAKFRWKNHKQFISLVNMLSLRNGGQFGPNDDGEDEEVEVDTSIHGNEPSVGDSKADKFKQHFLDSFAEIMSRDKGGKHVSCVALRGSGDRNFGKDVKISLLVARNIAFNEQDTKFCSTFERLLAAIGLPVIEKELREELVCYNQPRTDHYADSLRKNPKAFPNAGSLDSTPTHRVSQPLEDVNAEPTTSCDDPDIGPYSADTHDACMTFAQGCILEFDSILRSDDGPAWRSQLAERAYAIRRMRSPQILIHSCSKASVGHKLLKDILFLGRLESCLRTIMEAAQRLPGFAQLSIVLVENLEPRTLSCKLPPLTDAMQRLGHILDTITVKKFISKKSSIIKVKRRFRRLQRKLSRKPLHIHAELQFIFYITKTAYNEIMSREIHPYIGCSKLSCFLCAAFIKCFALDGVTFRTRGSHRKIYTRWSIPNMDGLEDDVVVALNSALEEMQSFLRSEFMKPIISTTHLPESSAEVTDDADDTDDQPTR
ncbi:hypothetical protein EDD16DRAFT_466218 [Pisolithus croceorrhizus]|nr:hypothetical protein EDD16DRAFT_466218 [Pisolithus croceorrhizus]KAI6159915.1 hypothetical protein EDD17DRAFT_1898448 [Pisolithus thermaeus]